MANKSVESEGRSQLGLVLWLELSFESASGQGGKFSSVTKMVSDPSHFSLGVLVTILLSRVIATGCIALTLARPRSVSDSRKILN